jgi:hypothetical protein
VLVRRHTAASVAKLGWTAGRGTNSAHGSKSASNCRSAYCCA